MDPKTFFLASLSDEQLGFFYAHEYDENLSELLQDEISIIQYQLYEKWRIHQRTVAHENIQQALTLNELSEKMSQVISMLTERMDSIESKIDKSLKLTEKADELHSSSLDNVTEKMRELSEMFTAKMDIMEHKLEDKFKQVENQLTNIHQQLESPKDVKAQPIDVVVEKPKLVEENHTEIEKNIISLGNNKEWEQLNDKVDTIWAHSVLKPDMDENSAIEWLASTESVMSYTYAIPDIRNKVETMIAIMRNFETNTAIQEKRCNILDTVANAPKERFKLFVHYISNTPGAIKHLMHLVETVDKEIKLKALRILAKIAHCQDNRKVLMKREYIHIFLKELSAVDGTSNRFYVTCILVQLLDFTGEQFFEKTLKETIESRIISIIDKLEPNKIRAQNLQWYLDRIKSGTRAQRQFSAWIIANESKAIFGSLKNVGAITILEEIISNPKTDIQVSKYVQISLDNSRKSFLQKLFQ